LSFHTFPFSLYPPPDLPTLPSFPTRRSSDLDPLLPPPRNLPGLDLPHPRGYRLAHRARGPGAGHGDPRSALARSGGRAPPRRGRSEEHTSELQSLRHLVCRLLLEKKKNINIHTTNFNEKNNILLQLYLLI